MPRLAAVQCIHGGGYLPSKTRQLSWKSRFHNSVLAGIQGRIALAVSHLLGDKAVVTFLFVRIITGCQLKVFPRQGVIYRTCGLSSAVQLSCRL